MKWFSRAVLLAGLATLAVLLWKFDAGTVWDLVAGIGWGFALVIPLQACDHVINALGWRFAFAPEHAGRVPMRRLVWARVAGDAVNYLTPSGTIAGEIIRPALLGPSLPAEVKAASVVVAKFAQAIGQALFILAGLLTLMALRLDLLAGRERALAAGGAALVTGLSAFTLWLLTSSGRRRDSFWARHPEAAAAREQMRRYLRAHPGRFAASTAFFAAGFAWGVIEVMLLCRFLGLRVGPAEALAVETLSNVVDSLLFMVPAKVGTQEGGKTAIFHALGFPAALGLAFGVARHVRELAWAGGGLALYAWTRRR